MSAKPNPVLNLPREEQTVALEQLVDQIGLYSVLQVLSTICYYKSDHLREAWQDQSLAPAQWVRAGAAIDRVSNLTCVEQVSP